MDYSLDTIQLEKVYTKATRRKNFTFTVDDRTYTQQIINVNFNYNCYEYNNSGNTYVKAGYNVDDCKFEDCVYILDGQLIGIKINNKIQKPINEDLLGKYFRYDETENEYKKVKKPPTVLNREELRKHIYEYGFVCDGIKYVRYKRSSGSSRIGKCLFINEKLYKKMSKFDNCGIEIYDGKEIDLAAFESYISLTSSSIIDTINIEPKNILIIEDYESKFKDKVVSVEEQNGELIATEKETEISNSIWDGQSLMDISLFGKYSDKGMLLLRNRFFKSCAFNCNLQQWFKDNNITSVKQLNGFTLAQDIDDVKLITTPSSIKYMKFGSKEDWLKHIDSTFGIVKYEKKPKFQDGTMVLTHYQLLNTLQMTYEEVEELLEPSFDYMNKLRTDPDVLRKHIEFPYDDEGIIRALDSREKIIFKLLSVNDRFVKTKLYNDFKSGLIDSIRKDLRTGKILVNGNYSTLLGNGLEMLKHAIYKFNYTSELNGYEVISKRFKPNINILASRSPHICAGNIGLLNNVSNDKYDKYFNLTQEIICVNAINTNIQQRFNGLDYDSDTVLLTDNQILINAAKRNYNNFLVPTNDVPMNKMQRHYTNEHKTDLDYKTSVNKIGEIVNLSQKLNSILWDNLNKGRNISDIQDLYLDICKLAILSNIEIDKAKKETIINTEKELRKCKAKYNLQGVKPLFFKFIDKKKGYDTDNIKYRHYNTAMDYAIDIIDDNKFTRGKNLDKELFVNILKNPNVTNESLKQRYYYQRLDFALNNIKEAKTKLDNIHSKIRNTNNNIIKESLNTEIDYTKRKYHKAVNSILRNQAVVYLLFKELDKEENKGLLFLTLEILLYNPFPNEYFLNLLNESKEDLNKLVEDKDGDIILYQRTFKRTKSA